MLIARESQLIFAIAPLPMLVPGSMPFFNAFKHASCLASDQKPEAQFDSVKDRF